MAKLTLLEIVQDILNDNDCDPVDSINDTEEALQVAQIVKTSLFEMYNTRNWPHLRTVTQLDSVSSSNPVKLKLPELCKELESLMYNKRSDTDTKDKYQEVHYIEPVEFLIMSNNRNSSADNVQTVTDYDDTKLYIINNKAPQYWTTFDDEFIVFDSFDEDVDSALQPSKTQAVMYKSTTFQFSDTFIPDLPEEAFSALVAEAKSTASVVLRQETNGKAEQKARRSQAYLSRKARRAAGGYRYPDFGRRSYSHQNPYLQK